VAPIVQDVLLNEQSLDNGLFDADGVRQVVRDHLENRKNHTFLIMALMTYELGRKFLAN